MKILDYLSGKNTIVNIEGKSKKEVIRELLDLMEKNGDIKDVSEALETIMAREELGTTAVGMGIAIPHSRVDFIDDIVASFGISREGVDFGALDGEKVHMVFLFLSPLGVDSTGKHLKLLAKVSRIFKDKFFRQSLMESKTPQEIIALIKEEDEF